MIRKIQSSEYLKRYDDMTAAERAEYESRVGDWLSVDGQSLVKRCETFEARLQNVLQAQGIRRAQDVYYLQINDTGEVTLQKKD